MQRPPRRVTWLAPLSIMLWMAMLLTGCALPGVAQNTNNLSLDNKEAQVVQIAQDFIINNDLEQAKAKLADLQVPNSAQFVSLVAEQSMNEAQTPDQTRALILLAEALGGGNARMALFVATATPTTTFTPIPTNTSTPTETPTTTPTATETPVPTQKPTRVLPTKPAVTNTPRPPTATPKPAVDYRVVKSRLLSKTENGGCEGNHNFFFQVLDAGGAPVNGAVVQRIFSGETSIAGSKDSPWAQGTQNQGWGQFDIFKNGDQLKVIADPAKGNNITSEVTRAMGVRDEEISIAELIGGGYCSSEAECTQLVAENRLCRFHYSYEVVFQRTW